LKNAHLFICAKLTELISSKNLQSLQNERNAVNYFPPQLLSCVIPLSSRARITVSPGSTRQCSVGKGMGINQHLQRKGDWYRHNYIYLQWSVTWPLSPTPSARVHVHTVSIRINSGKVL